MGACPHGIASRWACEPCSVEDDAKKRIEIAAELQSDRHHEVLCLVLKELFINVRSTNIGGDFVPSSNIERVKIAREYADLAYPPPKAEGT